MASWAVRYEDAYQVWLDRARPTADQIIAVLSWLIAVAEGGPPDDALPVPLTEDFYISRVEQADVFVEYLALAYEQYVIVRRID